jgi:hypothetical protein
VNAPLKRSSSLAVISLVSGLLGWTLLPWLGSIAAIITGHMARAEIRRDPETMEGDGMAVAGLVLGYSMVALSILAIVAIFLFFGGLALFLGWMGASGHLN